MPTITTVVTGVVVVGLVLAVLPICASVLTSLVSRHGQVSKGDPNARRLRLKSMSTRRPKTGSRLRS